MIRQKSLQTALLATLISGAIISCGYKTDIGDKVYVQRKAVGNGTAFVVHSTPDCPEVNDYMIEPLDSAFFTSICSKCINEEDAETKLNR